MAARMAASIAKRSRSGKARVRPQHWVSATTRKRAGSAFGNRPLSQCGNNRKDFRDKSA